MLHQLLEYVASRSHSSPGISWTEHAVYATGADGQKRDHAHYPTVIAACSIITDNESNVWLSRSASGDTNSDVDIGDLLPAGDYFLHVHRRDVPSDAPYPIVANFRAWEFPHDALPQLWQDASSRVLEAGQSPSRELDLVAGESCRITTNRLACEDAHIIPSSEKSWFTSNEMDQYGQISGRSGDTVADTWVNKMRLQAQAHRLWDTYAFSIVPRRLIAESDEVSWYTQMLNEDDELERDWHCTKVQPLQGRACQFLYARYAFDIFPRLHAFLQGGQPRSLVVRLPDGTKTVRMYSAPECREFATRQGRGRSASPTKRARSATEGPADSFLAACCNDQTTCARCMKDSGSRGCSATSEGADSAIGVTAVCPNTRRKLSDPSNQYSTEWMINVYHDDVDYERGRKRFRT